MLNISVKVNPTDIVQLERRLTRVTENAVDFTGPMGRNVQKAYQGDEFDLFFHTGRGGWPPLRPSTVEFKDRYFPFMPMMQRTQKLYRSLIGTTEDTVYEAQKKSLTLGTRARSKKGFSYPLAHQRGTSRMAMRQVLSLSEKGKRDIVRQVQRDAIGNARQEWGTSVRRRGYVQTELEDFE